MSATIALNASPWALSDYQGPLTGAQHTESKTTFLNSTFNGASGLVETSILTTGTNFASGFAIDVNSTGKVYYKPVSTGVLAFYGASLSAVSFGQTVTSTTTYTPPYVNGVANLAVGETGTFVSSGAVTSTGPGSGPFSNSQTVKFVGKESITVPAGTFNACRYETLGSGGAVINGTSWYYRSLVIKSSAPGNGGTQIIQLKSATINGAPI